jgi:drug/metabolite transporter (DMT)-like permease
MRLRASSALDAVVAVGSIGAIIWGVLDLVAERVSGVFLVCAGASAFAFTAQRLRRTLFPHRPPTQPRKEGLAVGGFFALTGAILLAGAVGLLVRDLSALNVAVAVFGIFCLFLGVATFLASRQSN